MNGESSVGVYQKYYVKRHDGRDTPGSKHHSCKLFVLDADHDPFAVAALSAYADACESEYPTLAKELRGWVDQHVAN